MKILIIGIARSGTTSLLKGIESQGFHSISEPYNKWVREELSYPLQELNNHTNIVIKTNGNQKPKKYKGSWVDFILEFSKSFDKLIFLDRYDFNEHYESIMNLWYKSHIQKQSVMSEWVSEDIPDLFRVGFASGGGRQGLQKEKKELKQLATELNCDITYYEDLYSKDRSKANQTITDLKLQVDTLELSNYLDPKYKLKKTKKNLL